MSFKAQLVIDVKNKAPNITLNIDIKNKQTQIKV